MTMIQRRNNVHRQQEHNRGLVKNRSTTGIVANVMAKVLMQGLLRSVLCLTEEMVRLK